MAPRHKAGRRTRKALLVDSGPQGHFPGAHSAAIGELTAKIRKRLGSTVWDLYSFQYERLWTNHPDYEEATALMQQIVDGQPRIGEDQNRLAGILNSGILAPRITYPTSSHAAVDAGSSNPTTTSLAPTMQRTPLDEQQHVRVEQVEATTSVAGSINELNKLKSGARKKTQPTIEATVDLDMELYEDPPITSTKHPRPRIIPSLATSITHNSTTVDPPVAADPPASKWNSDPAWARAQRFARNVDLSWLDQQFDSDADIPPTRSSFYEPDSLTTEGRSHFAQEYKQSLRDAHRFWH